MKAHVHCSYSYPAGGDGRMNIALPGASEAGWSSVGRLLGTFFELLNALTTLLGRAESPGERLRQPLERVPIATYAARYGVALPTEVPTVPTP